MLRGAVGLPDAAHGAQLAAGVAATEPTCADQITVGGEVAVFADSAAVWLQAMQVRRGTPLQSSRRLRDPSSLTVPTPVTAFGIATDQTSDLRREIVHLYHAANVSGERVAHSTIDREGHVELLEGKKALITGSRRGIGAGIAVAFAEHGADVGINDLARDTEADRTIARVEELGRKASWHLADIGSAGDRTRMFDEFITEHGRIDVLVNNAVGGAGEDNWFLDITEESWEGLVGHALKGYLFCSQRAAREMISQGDGGSIISISSVHSYRAWPGDTVYGVVKAGLNRMVLSMALDLAGNRIRANCIAPGYIDSRVLAPEEEPDRGKHAEYALPQIPSRRGGVPRDIAGAAIFLASDLGDYVNGQTITVDGGLLVGGTPSES